MLWRASGARGYFLGQLPEDGAPDDVGAKMDAPGSAADVAGFESVLEEAEEHLDRRAATLETVVHDGDNARRHERRSQSRR